MRFNGALAFNTFVLVFFGYMVWEAWAWDPQARLFPWVIGIPMLFLAAGHLVVEFRGGQKQKVEGSRPVDIEFAKGIDPVVARSRTLASFAWIIGFLVSIWLLGFSISTALVVFLYLKVQAREGLVLSLILTCGAWLLYYVLFERVLKLPFEDGKIFDWLGLS